MSVPDEILRLFQPETDDAALTVGHREQPFARQPLTERDLLRAIHQHELELHFQPQLDLHSGEILSVEALLRWNRPGEGLLLPSAFLGFAAERELIAEIDDWTLAAAAEQALIWARAGLPPFGVAVNVAAQQFHAPGFVQNLARSLASKRVSPKRMEVEITESVIMHDPIASLDVLSQLHELGVTLSIDDFGTGYSSLTDLRSLPIDEIKIDRSFVHQMKRDARVAGTVRGIVELAHGLKLQVLAEGVETCDQMKRLIDLNCDRAQGFLISRPMSPGQLERFVEDWPARWKMIA